MNVVNYDKLMTETVKGLDRKPTLLLHSCCAPCSSYCIEELVKFFRLTVFYYNPNIDTDEEYEKRKNEQKRFIAEFAPEVEFIGEEHESEEFYKAVKGLENEPEGGKRCRVCFALRLSRTAEKAKENGYEFFATTLTISPLKNAKVINEVGLELERTYGVKYLPTDFKKRGGYLRSTVLSQRYGIYRQDYCGCVFSRESRTEKNRF
mgnify:FL=1